MRIRIRGRGRLRAGRSRRRMGKGSSISRLVVVVGEVVGRVIVGLGWGIYCMVGIGILRLGSRVRRRVLFRREGWRFMDRRLVRRRRGRRIGVGRRVLRGSI